MIFSYKKINAKVNLTLDVLGRKDGFHTIESFVSSITICDRVLVTKRKDHAINFKQFGIRACKDQLQNNAYLAAKAFMETYGTTGVNLYLHKKIPVGGGLGGSSADIAAVLVAMKNLYKVDADLTVLAQKLGSDVVFMLNGGNAVMRGRGEDVVKINISRSLPLILIKNNRDISSKNCYKKFDELNEKHTPCTKIAVENLAEGRFYDFCKVAKNDLENAANQFIPELDNAKNYLIQSGAYAAMLTGSGSVVYGIFDDKSARKKAYESLKKVYNKERIILAETIKDKKLKY